MNTQHTPGPWKLGALDITPFGTGFSIGIDAESHGELALVVWQMEEDKIDDRPSLECEANAKLIAASPELLEALEALIFSTDAIPVNTVGPTKINAVILSRHVARLAIKKARGEQ